MSEPRVACGVSHDCVELLLQEMFGAGNVLQTEIIGNGAQASQLMNLAGVKKFRDVDPLESAAASVILRDSTGGTAAPTG